MVGPLAVTVGDVLTSPGSLVLTATSSDHTVVPDGSIALGGSGANRTVTFTPISNASGSTVITLTVTDESGITSSWPFTVNVTAVPDPPVITIPDLRDYTIVEDHPLGPIDLTISDVESAPGDLAITVSSSNDALIPDANVVLGGTGPSYTLTATPLANATGSTIITITAFDGAATTDVTFVLTVLPQPSYTNYAAGMQPLDGTIRVFDTGARRLWSSLGPVPGQVVAAAATPDGRRIYVTQVGLHSVGIFDAVDGSGLGSIFVGAQLAGLAVTRDGSHIYVANQLSGTVSVINVVTSSVINTITLSGAPTAVVASPVMNRVYVTTFGTDTLYQIDTTTNTVTNSVAIGLSSYSIAITPDGTTAYVVSTTDGTIVPVDLTTFTAGTPFGGCMPGPAGFALAIGPDGRLYLVDAQTHKITVFDSPTTGFIIGTGTLVPTSIDFTPDGKLAYVYGTGGNNVVILDMQTFTITSPPMNLSPWVHAIGPFIGPNVIVPGTGTPAAPLTIASDGALEALGFDRFVVFKGGTLRLTGQWNATRHVSLLPGGGTIDTGVFDATIDGTIAGAGALIKRGTGTLMAGPMLHAGGTTIAGGRLVLDGQHSGPVTVQASAMLAGSGVTGNVNMTAGTLSPGIDAGTAGISVNQLTMSASATLRIHLNSDIPATGYDHVNVNGTAAINGASLSVSRTFHADARHVLRHPDQCHRHVRRPAGRRDRTATGPPVAHHLYRW